MELSSRLSRAATKLRGGKKSRSQPVDLYAVEHILRNEYGQPRHGNKRDPFNELLFVILSLQTSAINCHRSYRSLLDGFGCRSSLASASRSQIRRHIEIAGLGRQRAGKIVAIVRAILKDRGELSLAFLRRMNTEDAEDYLTRLPGVGKKTARCVLMYSLDREVFPLDTHCARILKRLGFKIPAGSLRRCEDEIQSLIPAGIRYSLHVTMVSLGREICTSRAPKCRECPMLSICPTGRSIMAISIGGGRPPVGVGRSVEWPMSSSNLP